MSYLLLFASIFLAVLKSSVYNNYAKNVKPDTDGIFLFNTVGYGVAVIAYLCFGIGSKLSPATFYSAIFYAVSVCSLQALTIAAMKIGSMSSTSLMVLYGMIIPSIAGPIFWKEDFSFWQGVGVVLILISMWLLSKDGSKEENANNKWKVLAVLCFVLSGCAGLAEKIHQSTDGRNERTMFLFTAYLIMFVVSVIGHFILKKGKKVHNKPILINGGITGIIVAFYGLTNLTLAGTLDSLIYYPVANGGALLFTVLISVTLFKEKCTKRHIWGFISGFAAILLLSLPI